MRAAARAIGLLWLAAAATAGAAEDPWTASLKDFRQRFAARPGVPTAARRAALDALVATKDPRAVTELLETYRTEEKRVARLRQDWAEAEERWRETEARVAPGYGLKAEEARKAGISRWALTPEEADWFGSSAKPGRRDPEKRRIEGLYRGVLDEEETSALCLRGVARVIAGLDPAAAAKASAPFVAAARSADARHRADFVRALGWVAGEPVTALLEQFTRDLDPGIVQIAVEAIGRQNAPRGLDLLVARLDDFRWQVRAAAIEALVRYQDPRAVEALLAGAATEEGVLQRAYFVALSRLTQANVVGTLPAWRTWWLDHRDEVEARWKGWTAGEPGRDVPPPLPVETPAGSTSFYGVSTNSKHILYVLDVSTSMALESARGEGGRLPIEVARAELWNAIRSMSSEGDERGESTFNVVIFAGDVTVYQPGKMVPVTKRSKEDVKRWIDENTTPRSFTNIFDALETAFRVISATSDAKNLAKGADTLYFMTDGKPTGGRFLDPEVILREVRRMNETRRITIHSIGVGRETDPSFLRRLAEQNGGQYIAR